MGALQIDGVTRKRPQPLQHTDAEPTLAARSRCCPLPRRYCAAEWMNLRAAGAATTAKSFLLCADRRHYSNDEFYERSEMRRWRQRPITTRRMGPLTSLYSAAALKTPQSSWRHISRADWALQVYPAVTARSYRAPARFISCQINTSRRAGLRRRPTPSRTCTTRALTGVGSQFPPDFRHIVRLSSRTHSGTNCVQGYFRSARDLRDVRHSWV